MWLMGWLPSTCTYTGVRRWLVNNSYVILCMKELVKGVASQWSPYPLPLDQPPV